MNDPWLPPEDEQLLARLGAIAHELDPPPPMIYQMGYQVYQLYRIDDELAELVADSWLDSHAVREVASDTRLLSFEGPGAAIDIEVVREGATLSILGQLTRSVFEPVRGRAFLEFRSGQTVSSGIDGDGWFEFTAPPKRLVRFRIETPGAPTVITAWTKL